MSSRVGAATESAPAPGPVAMERRVLLAASRAAMAALLTVAILFLVRRLAGELQQPLGGAAFLAVAFTLGAVAALVRWTAWRLRPAGSTQDGFGGAPSNLLHAWESRSFAPVAAGQWIELLELVLPGLSAAVLLGAITLAGTPPWAVFLAWFGSAAAEASMWCLAAGRLCGKGGLIARPIPVTEETCLVGTDASAEAELPAGLVQQMTRIRQDGAESLHVLIQAEVPIGERLAIVHLAFCPPLDATPQLEAHAIDADDAEVRIALAETFGARLEVRLPHAATTARQVLVEMLGTAAATRQRSRVQAG